MEPFWERVEGQELRQGDMLPDCFVPVFRPEFGQDLSKTERVAVDEYHLIVLTQSCDLANHKARLVALSPIYPLAEFEEINPDFKTKGAWESVRLGRREGLHLLASPTNPKENRLALVVDFREIYSLPFEYLSDRALQLGQRWRLKSPFLEHYSQAFARFFMRVGLPSSIPPYPR
jgi:hypothetical protein